MSISVIAAGDVMEVTGEAGAFSDGVNSRVDETDRTVAGGY